jgi:hypothetical protein
MGRNASLKPAPILGILFLMAVAATVLAAVTISNEAACGSDCTPARFGSSAFGAAGQPGAGA